MTPHEARQWLELAGEVFVAVFLAAVYLRFLLPELWERIVGKGAPRG